VFTGDFSTRFTLMGPRIFGFEFFEILHESRKLAFGGSIAVNYNGMIFESVGENLAEVYYVPNLGVYMAIFGQGCPEDADSLCLRYSRHSFR
jgi:hypothetical protein